MALPLARAVAEEPPGGHQRRHRHPGRDGVDPVGGEEQPDHQHDDGQPGHRPGRREAQPAGGGANQSAARYRRPS